MSVYYIKKGYEILKVRNYEFLWGVKENAYCLNHSEVQYELTVTLSKKVLKPKIILENGGAKS